MIEEPLSAKVARLEEKAREAANEAAVHLERAEEYGRKLDNLRAERDDANRQRERMRQEREQLRKERDDARAQMRVGRAAFPNIPPGNPIRAYFVGGPLDGHIKMIDRNNIERYQVIVPGPIRLEPVNGVSISEHGWVLHYKGDRYRGKDGDDVVIMGYMDTTRYEPEPTRVTIQWD